MKKAVAAVLSVMLCFAVLCSQGIYQARTVSEYEEKAIAFIHDPRWANGTSWNGSQRSKIAPGSGVGCFAYASDFVQYVHNRNYVVDGTKYTDATEIQPGDILYFVDSYSHHWLAVLRREGDTLIYCDGNSSSRVTVGSTLTIADSKTVNGVWGTYSGYMSFSCGYHYEVFDELPESSILQGDVDIKETDEGYQLSGHITSNKINNIQVELIISDEFGNKITSISEYDTNNDISISLSSADSGLLKPYRRYCVQLTAASSFAEEMYDSGVVYFGENRLETVEPFTSGIQDLGEEFDAVIYRNYDKQVLTESEYYFYDYTTWSTSVYFNDEYTDRLNGSDVPAAILFHFTRQEDGSYIIKTGFQDKYLSTRDGTLSNCAGICGTADNEMKWFVYGSKGNYFLTPADSAGLIMYCNEEYYYTRDAELRLFDEEGIDYKTSSLSIRIPGTFEETGTPHDLAHDFGPWIYDGAFAGTHSRICSLDHFVESEACSYDEGVTDGNLTVYTCSVCGGKYYEVSIKGQGITRVSGSNRFGTAKAITTVIKNNKKAEKLDAVILACSSNFADALAGSYLAAVKDAPILITNTSKAAEINRFIKDNLVKGGTVYVLGGTAAVPDECLKGLEKYTVKRLAGSNRYTTNLEILREAGVSSDKVLVGTGTNFADSLSASATGLPLLLVKSANYDLYSFVINNQDKDYYILGGTGAVSREIEDFLKDMNVRKVTRLAGATRYETSALIASEFFPEASCALIAYAMDFPDGLCGGPLAYQIGAPLLLTAEGKTSEARHFMRDHGIKDGYVLGGTSRLADELVRKVFYLDDNVVIASITD